MVDSLPQMHIGFILVGTNKHETNSYSISIPKPQNGESKLTIDGFVQKKIFNFDPTCSELQIYLKPMGLDFSCGVNDVRRLKKTKHGYLDKFNVFDEIREKPWKKGSKRVVKHYYQLR